MSENVTPVMITEAISAVKNAIAMLERIDAHHHVAAASAIVDELQSMLPPPPKADVVPLSKVLPRRKKVETVTVANHISKKDKPEDKPRTDTQALNVLTGVLKKEEEILIKRARELANDKGGARLARLAKKGLLWVGDAVVRLKEPLARTPLLNEASNDQLLDELIGRGITMSENAKTAKEGKNALKVIALLEKLAELI
jgi:hypothetical protein